MKNSPIRFFLLVSHIAIAFSVNAQQRNITTKDAIEYLNTKLKGSYEFSYQSRVLYLSSFDADGKKKRSDAVDLEGINAEAISFEQDGNQVALKCYANQAECIERELFGVRKKTHISRTAIEVKPDGKTEYGVAKALQHLVKEVQFPKYKNGDWFE